MSYAHSHSNLVALLVRGLEAEVRVPGSQAMHYEPPTRASLCDCAALWGPRYGLLGSGLPQPKTTQANPS